MAEEPTGALVLEVQGVGYELSTPVGTADRVRSQRRDGDEVELWVHTHVREDALELFGFSSESDRRVFRLLLSVPNVGPKTGLGLLSALSVEELAAAVENADRARLGKVPGIGKKTAERLILELKEKLGAVDRGAVAARAGSGDQSARLMGALIHMGYRPAEAERAIAALGPRVQAEPLSDLLREALARLTP